MAAITGCSIRCSTLWALWTLILGIVVLRGARQAVHINAQPA